METTEHTLQDLLGEISLTEKKLNKIDNLDKAVITDRERPTFGYNDGIKKFDLETAKRAMQSRVDSYEALVERLLVFRTLRDSMNLSTEFNVEGKKFTIHSALMWKTVLSKKLKFLYGKITESARNAEYTAENSTKTSFVRRREAGAKRNEAPVEVIPLIDVKRVEKELEVISNIEERLDAAITRVNSTTSVAY